MILYGHDEAIAKWVSEHLPERPAFGKCVAVGVVKPKGAFPQTRDDRLLAGVVWHDYRGHDIMASIYAASPRWVARPKETLAELFAYPFLQLGVARVTVLASRANKRARHMNERLGFRLEGTMRKGWDGKTDAMLYGMLRNECRWIAGHPALERKVA